MGRSFGQPVEVCPRWAFERLYLVRGSNSWPEQRGPRSPYTSDSLQANSRHNGFDSASSISFQNGQQHLKTDKSPLRRTMYTALHILLFVAAAGRAATVIHFDEKRPNHRCASSVVHKSGCGRSTADYSPRFLPTDGQIGMYGPPLQRHRGMSAKSTSITQAAPQRRELPRQSAHAVVRKSGHQLRTLVAAGIDSRAHLTRVLAQHCARGGADRPRSLNLKQVSPCHSSCTGRCTRFGNNQRKRQPAAAVHSDIGESRHNTAQRE